MKCNLHLRHCFTMHILTNIHKMCIVKVKASNLSENRRALANIAVVADQNILLYNPQQYILSQHSHYPSAAAYTNISYR
jgi:hypothetical protein